MIKRLAHINIGTPDLAAAEHFYCDVLGMKKTFEFIKDGEPFGFYLAAGETTFVEVFVQAEGADCQRPMMHHLCLEVEDIDHVIETVRARGWKISDKKMGGDNAWQAWMNDPGGVPIEVMQYTPRSSQFTGEPCIVDW